jgi:hypothetical protein
MNIPNRYANPIKFQMVNSPLFPIEKIKKQGAHKIASAKRQAAVIKPA